MAEDRKPFMRWYMEQARTRRTVLCAGLDPTPEHLPPSFGTFSLKALREYLHGVIDRAAVHAAVIKPQSAYYEAFGPNGTRLLIDLVEYAHDRGLPVILDAKRADIGPTMEAYGRFAFEQVGADACTFVPYFGPTFLPSEDGKSQGWMPWLERGRCVISMIRTSNPEGTPWQDQLLASVGTSIYEQQAHFVACWDRQVHALTGGMGLVGGVVGATVPDQAAHCRELAPDAFFLIPGYGAQGGGADGAVASFPADGRRLGTVNSSRAITTAWRDKDGSEKMGDPLHRVEMAMADANTDLNHALAAKFGRDPYGI